MDRFMGKKAKELLVMVLSLAIIFGTIPGTTISYAATQQYPDGVTVTVVDEEGNPIEGATVDYTVNSVSDGDGFLSGREITNEYGSVETVSGGNYREDDLKLSVIVSKEGYEAAIIEEQDITLPTQDFLVTLIRPSIEDVVIRGKEWTFDGDDYEVVYVDVQEGDQVTYQVNGGEILTTNPTVSGADLYNVTVTVKRDGYRDKVETVTTTVNKADISDIDIFPRELVYDGTEQELVTLSGEFEDNDNVTWTVIHEDLVSGGDAGIRDIPRAVEGGTYSVELVVDRGSNYELFSKRVYAEISPTDQRLVFDEYPNGQPSYAVREEVSPFENNVYNFEASVEDGHTDGEFVYEIVEIDKHGNKIFDTDIASIDENGRLTVAYAGTVEVIATMTGNRNYKGGSVAHRLTVCAGKQYDGQFVKFQGNTVSMSYIFGENEGVVSELTADPTNPKDEGAITYRIDRTDIGLSCDENTGKIEIIDYVALGNVLHEENGTVTVTLTADKAADKGWLGQDIYEADSISCEIVISFMDTPANSYVSGGDMGIIHDIETGWYVTEVTVSPTDSDSYSITGACNTEGFNTNFGTSYVFDNQGIAERYIYLKNNTTGGITDRIPVEMKIDTERPKTEDMCVTFSELTLIQKLGRWFGFYNPSVTITFTAADVTSGIEHFNWKYVKETDAGSVNLESMQGEISATEKDGIATATLILPAQQAEQLRGSISFTATDKAGNVSNEVMNDTVIVVDTISPIMQARHELAQEGGVYNHAAGRHYYSNDVRYTFTVEEANFFPEDVSIWVSKDGEAAETVDATWYSSSAEDVYEGSFLLSGDGDYVVYMSYEDQSDNTMTDESGNVINRYQSDVITIDTISPVIDFRFDRGNQKVIFEVTEHNFQANAVEVTGSITDINQNPVAFTAEDLTTWLQTATWTKNGDTYTYETDEIPDAIYELEIDYMDVADRPAATKETGSFIIDHEKPEGVMIAYGNSWIETILEVVTLGFYNPSVTVTFTAYDLGSGVESFAWNYTRENGASDVNRMTDVSATVVEAVQDVNDKSKFTATITLPDSDAANLRGYLAVSATDGYGNESVKVTDSGNIIVVDSISPTMTVEYSQADRIEENEAYYKQDAVVTFIVTEANFFPEDIRVTVTQNAGEPYEIAPEWTDISVDEHIGRYTLTGDGHYVIHVEYTDRSNNSMAHYTSDVITIDTILPRIKVEYMNTNVVNNMTDNEGNDRKYFTGTQTAIVEITEHNFQPEEVRLLISAKDVAGQGLDAESLYSRGQWVADAGGDIYTMLITFPGDANYSFDVEYMDLATNEAVDYPTDYFTVDNNAPENFAVSYSTSIWEEVLEAISFGFYNAKMTVTLTAEDATSGVNCFFYSYLNAEGVSSVNAELVNEMISAEDINYTDNGRLATVQLYIPKDGLESDSQFNGNVEFTVIDRSGMEASGQDTKRIVVDSIAPTAEITYNEPVNVEDGVSYYDGNINATVTITEANFYPQDVEVLITKDGGTAYSVIPTWTDYSLDVHVGTFSMTEDGDYTITINYADKSSNAMATYVSEQLTIDTVLETPQVLINGEAANGKAYKGEVVPTVSFEDENFSDYEIVLTRTNYGRKDVDVTDYFVNDQITLNNKGGFGTLDVFDKIPENDGIYTLSVTIKDKAGHISDSEPIMFTVNRYGSVYEYSDYLVSLIENGGAYVKAITNDLIITEYNADRLISESLNIEITCDGKPLDEVYYDVSPAMNNQVAVGDSGWFQYKYAISDENFEADGVYKISVSSEDATGNTPENSNYDDKNILFRVDSTVPEITSIVGLEKSIINAQEATVSYMVFDAIGLKSVKTYVNGKQVEEAVIDLSLDSNNYSGSILLAESTSAQTVRIVVEDLAGNITDTNGEDFTSAYEFHPSVTVSTNAFVRWYANKPLFWGTVGGVVMLGGAGGAGSMLRRKKKGSLL